MMYDRSVWLKSYDPGVSTDVEIEHDSLPACFEYIRRERGNRPAVHYLGVTLTFDRLLAHADRFARCLADHGIGKGDVVAICLPNSPQYLIALVGALKAGCAASGLSPLHSAKEIRYQLNDSGAKALVVMDAIFEFRFMGIAGDVPNLQLVVPTGLLDFLPKVKQLLAKWLKKVPTGRVLPVPNKVVLPFMDVLSQYPAEPPDVPLTPEDPCFVQYTGGTTGLPKGALCVHRNMLTNVKQWFEWLKADNPDETILSAFPMFHVAGLFTALCGLTFGLPQVVIPNPRDTKLIVREIAKYRPQWLANVPSLYLMLLQEPGFHKLDFSDLNFCVSGAAPFSVEGIRQFEDVVGVGKVIEVYGMTETCVLITANPRSGVKKIGSVGLPLPSTKVKIVDVVSGEQEVPFGEVGEIIATGPQIMKGYYARPDETTRALRVHDGEVWMHTGDLGTMDTDGYVTIVDRAKDMISVSGYKVFPREVEEKLFEHPAVDLCAVIGIQNPERPETEMVKLVVQKSAAYSDKPDDEVSKQIIAFSRENFASYKVPRVVEFREIPLTPAGKVDKKALR